MPSTTKTLPNQLTRTPTIQPPRRTLMPHAQSSGQAVTTQLRRNDANANTRTGGEADGYLVAAAAAAATHLDCGGEANLCAPEVAARETSWELFCDRGQRKPRSQVGDIKGGGGRRRVGVAVRETSRTARFRSGRRSLVRAAGLGRRDGVGRRGRRSPGAARRRVWGGEGRGGAWGLGRKEDGGCLGW